MKNLKLVVLVSNNEKLISDIIKAASKAGAGNIGDYSEKAFVTVGIGRWLKSPNEKLIKNQEAKIEMRCPLDKADRVKNAIIDAHPDEEPVVEFYDILDI